ncbi:MAG TPA: CHASE3 domain-containing protein [Gemmatimonadaceae bacterium]|nr:CHASE3 domain-containing protein [Gemmatimonadaceae bacterium]
MSPKLTGNAQRRLLALIPAVLVLLVGALAFDQARNVVADVQDVGRSHGIIEGSDAVLARAVDAETGQRAFLLTGNEAFLELYVGARADIDTSLDSLRRLTQAEPAQLARLTTIGRLVSERFALLDSGITLRRHSAAGAASESRLMAGKNKMDQLRSIIGDLHAQEQDLLAQRRVVEQRSVRNASLAVGAAGIMALIISALVNLAFSRALMDRDSANRALKTVNEDLEHQSKQLEEQAVEMESQAAELEATAEDLRTTNDELSRTTIAAEKARDLAEDARHRLERVLDNLPDAATVFDSEWRWTYVNPSAARILLTLGVNPSHAIGKVVWDLLPALRESRFETETLRAVRESTVAEYEEYVPALDAWAETSIVPLSGAVMVFSRDITRRKREQQGAQLLGDASRVLASTLDYEKTLEAVARLAVGGLADWCAVDLSDSEGRVRQVVVSHRDEAKIRWAKELNKRYPPNYSGPTGVGHVIRTGHAELYADISDDMLVAAARDADHLGIMRELQIKSALIVPMIARGRTLGALTLISSGSGRRYDEADQALAMELATRAAIAIDNAQLYRSALAASESKSAFLATMSHELRTPLNAIIGYQSLLAEGIDGRLNESQLVQLTRIRASADHLLGLIDEVLTFSRLDVGKEVVRRDEVRVAAIVAEALTMVTPLAESKGLKLRDETVDAGLFTDHGKVRQILLNLLSNAIKFSDDGDIVIRSRVDRDSVAISIIDPGIGIAAENIVRIFDPFWQVEQRSTRKVGGTGLGLSVSRSLARLLGGDVSVESAVDHGSTFTLTLPTRRGANT